MSLLTTLQKKPEKGKKTVRSDKELERKFILKTLSDHTARTYRTILNEFVEFVGRRNNSKVSYAEITGEDVLEWRDFLLKNGKSANTIRTKLSTLSSLFEFGRASGYFSQNPASSKIVPKPKKPRVSLKGRVLTGNEVKSLLAWFRQDSLLGARNYAMLLLMLRTSLRESEVAKLKISSIRRNSGRWTLQIIQKGGAEDIRPLPDEVKAAIDKYLALDRENRQTLKTEGADGYIFQAETNQRFFGKNQPLSTRQIWHIVKKTAKLTGIGHLTPHDLRRTAITTAFRLKIPIDEIQRMSGHADLSSLQIYNLDRQNLEENAINKLHYD